MRIATRSAVAACRCGCSSRWTSGGAGPHLGVELRGDALLHVAQDLMSTGDGYLTRSRYHAVGNSLHMSEQMNHQTGFEQGAPDLTWSYGTALSALNVRGHVFSALQAAVGQIQQQLAALQEGQQLVLSLLRFFCWHPVLPHPECCRLRFLLHVARGALR